MRYVYPSRNTLFLAQSLLIAACLGTAVLSLLVFDQSVHLGMDRLQAARNQITNQVWWFASYFAGTGYGAEAVFHTVGLYRTGLVESGKLKLTHFGNDESFDVLARMETSIRNDLLDLLRLGYEHQPSVDRTAIIVCHSVPDFWAVPEPVKGYVGARCPPYPLEEAAYVIGRTMWETDMLPIDQVERCNLMDEIWVPCEHNKQVYRNSGVVRPNLVVIPGAVDVHTLDPAKITPLPLPIGRRVFGREFDADGSRPFVFISVFDWSVRKGWDILLRAYLEGFGPQADGGGRLANVALIILTKSFFFTKEDPDFVRIIRSWVAENLSFTSVLDSDMDSKLLPRLYITDKHISDKTLARLYKAADAMVHPTRGEGWGRPHSDAMSMALPVIATNWSGITAFLDESVGYPLVIDGLVPVPDHMYKYSQGAQQRWALPSLEHLKHLMWHVVEHPKEAAAKGRAARAKMLQHFSPEVIGQIIAARLQAISNQLAIRNATNRVPVPADFARQERIRFQLYYEG